MLLNLLSVVCLVVFASGFSNNSTSKGALFPRLPNFVLESNNERCPEESEMYLDQLTNLTIWAYEIYDSTEKSVSGLLRGNVYQFGDWDECLSAPAPFKTQYCLAEVFARAPLLNHFQNLHSTEHMSHMSVLNKLNKKEDISQVRRDLAYIGLCLPATCTTDDLETTLNTSLKYARTYFTEHNVSYYAQISSVLCQTIDDYHNFDGTDKGFCFLVAILIMFLILGTVYDYSQTKAGEITINRKSKKSSFFDKLLISFSVRRNFFELQKGDKSPLSILHGIKVISICMIIMDHRFGTFTSGPVLNFDYIEQQYKAGTAFMIFHGDLFVDSFFVLSGILVAYILLDQFEKKSMNLILIFLMRYIRLAPVYAFVIFFYASIFENTGAGPLWKLIIGPEAEDCRRNWWISLLFLSNYINDDHMCMVHSWYLPCDFHYFIVATFLMRILTNHKKIGLSILVFLLILSAVIPFVITVIFKRPAMLLFYQDFLIAPKAHLDFQLTYSKSHTRASPYIIGLFAGYLYFKLKKSNWKLSKVSSHTLTFISIILLLGGIGSGAVFYNSHHPYNAVEAGIYAGFHRIVWALGTVGLLLTTTHGHTTFLKCILSWHPMIVLGKLVFSTYVIHMQYALRSVAGTKNPRYLSAVDLIPLVFGDIVLSFLTAFLLYLMVEMPFRKILKELFVIHVSNSGESVLQKNNRNNDTIGRIINKDDMESRL